MRYSRQLLPFRNGLLLLLTAAFPAYPVDPNSNVTGKACLTDAQSTPLCRGGIHIQVQRGVGDPKLFFTNPDGSFGFLLAPNDPGDPWQVTASFREPDPQHPNTFIRYMGVAKPRVDIQALGNIADPRSTD